MTKDVPRCVLLGDMGFSHHDMIGPDHGDGLPVFDPSVGCAPRSANRLTFLSAGPPRQTRRAGASLRKIGPAAG
ncbi:MAG: hypothetical protein AAGL89_18555 [Pseudomonadota bacterium]